MRSVSNVWSLCWARSNCEKVGRVWKDWKLSPLKYFGSRELGIGLRFPFSRALNCVTSQHASFSSERTLPKAISGQKVAFSLQDCRSVPALSTLHHCLLPTYHCHCVEGKGGFYPSQDTEVLSPSSRAARLAIWHLEKDFPDASLAMAGNLIEPIHSWWTRTIRAFGISRSCAFRVVHSLTEVSRREMPCRLVWSHCYAKWLRLDYLSWDHTFGPRQ